MRFSIIILFAAILNVSSALAGAQTQIDLRFKPDVPAIYIQGVTSDQQVPTDIPAGYAIRSVYLKNATDATVVVNIGTTVGGGDVLSSMSLGPKAFGPATISKSIFSASSEQSLFVSAPAGWNNATIDLVIRLERAIP
jgi:hypothetical protein